MPEKIYIANNDTDVLSFCPFFPSTRITDRNLDFFNYEMKNPSQTWCFDFLMCFPLKYYYIQAFYRKAQDVNLTLYICNELFAKCTKWNKTRNYFLTKTKDKLADYQNILRSKQSNSPLNCEVHTPESTEGLVTTCSWFSLRSYTFLSSFTVTVVLENKF